MATTTTTTTIASYSLGSSSDSDDVVDVGTPVATTYTTTTCVPRHVQSITVIATFVCFCGISSSIRRPCVSHRLETIIKYCSVLYMLGAWDIDTCRGASE